MVIAGIIEDTNQLQSKCLKDSNEWNFYEAVKITNNSLVDLANRYSEEALKLANIEKDTKRKKELHKIAEVCKNVPLNPAKNLQEALQSIFFVQVAINLESLDNGITPGRMDQYLLEFYENDISLGKLNRNEAKELISAFCIKFSELIPIFSNQITEVHGGLMNGQVICVGGKNSDQEDETNELTYIFLEIMEELELRQPNFHARIHKDSPSKYLEKIFSVLASGNGAPALYNDEIIIKTMLEQGYSDADVHGYTPVGCVEPTVPGKSFASTDAALFNLASVFEKTLYSKNKYKTFSEFTQAFEKNLKSQIKRLIADLHSIEKANHKFHPTPLSSTYIDGCIESGTCSVAGGAVYNLSGVQCVGAVDIGDSLYAIKKAVFDDAFIGYNELLAELKLNFKDEKLRKKTFANTKIW